MPATAGSTAEQEKFEILGDTSISGDANTGEPEAKMDLSNSGSLKCLINKYYSKGQGRQQQKDC
jgi:hypothetical protein